MQRYLCGQSVQDSRRGLFLNAAAKIPMQLCILFIGVLVYVFYVFQSAPLNFQRLDQARLESSGLSAQCAPIKARYDTAFERRKRRRGAAHRQHQRRRRRRGDPDFGDAQRQLDGARREARRSSQRLPAAGASDTNYIFLTFVTQHLPVGVVGSSSRSCSARR